MVKQAEQLGHADLVGGSETDLHSHIGGSVTIVRKTADEVVNNSTTLQNDDHLFLPIGANEIWFLKFFIRGQSGTTPDFCFIVTVPSGATGSWTRGQGEGAGASNAANSFAVTGIINGKATIIHFILYAIVINGGNAGNVQLQWAQNYAYTSDSTVYANSCIIAHQLA